MSEEMIIKTIKNTFKNCHKVKKVEKIQELWSGYGGISRWELKGSEVKSLVIKDIHFEAQKNHPKGWNTQHSHLRKLKSYQVELNWYTDWSMRCDESCKLPVCFAAQQSKNGMVLLLEDLDEAGYSIRRQALTIAEANRCLSWLANFHARFMQYHPNNLWENGCYWHLATRKEEWEKMENGWLKTHAKAIDQKLSSAKYQTIVHGDAKVSNFCFSEDMKHVAAVDFQYVGKGCGIKDVAYFMGSCLTAEACESFEEDLLENYFYELENALSKLNMSIDIKELEAEWRGLYPIAWTDFTRFLKGWMPEHKKINSYSQKMVEKSKSTGII